MTDKNIPNEIGFDYFSSIGDKSLSLSYLSNPEDKFEQIINRYGRFQIYEEMVKNDAMVGAFNNLLESFATVEELLIKPSDDSEEAKKYCDIIKSMLFDDMEVPFSESFRDWLTMTIYGFSLSEIVFKKRLGSNPNNPKKHSKFNDGLIGIRKFAPRPQKTIRNWNYDTYGRISNVGQSVVGFQDEVKIPYNKLLHFKIKSYNGNPEGTSIFRNCALSFYEKTKISKDQKIRFSRGFAGIPRVKIPHQWGDTNNPQYAAYRKWAEDTAKNLRNGVDAGIVLLNIPMPDGKTPAVDVDILSNGSTDGIDADKMIDRLDGYIATSLLSDFFLIGKTSSMSGSIGSAKINVFKSLVIMILGIICNELNNKLVPIIFDINNFDKKYMPKISHTNLATVDLTNILLFVQSLGKTGLWTKTKDRENALINLLFGGAIPEVGDAEFEKQQLLNNTKVVENISAQDDTSDGVDLVEEYKN